MIPGNLHVSGCHCVLTRHLGSKVTLKDTSSNGTLLNGKRVEKNMEVRPPVSLTILMHLLSQVEVAHNDVITIVNRKDNPRLSECGLWHSAARDGFCQTSLTGSRTCKKWTPL